MPSPMERTCLQHLDAVDNWRILGTERPEESTHLPWRPFLRIFFINLTTFTALLSALFVGLEAAAGTLVSIVEDLPLFGPG